MKPFTPLFFGPIAEAVWSVRRSFAVAGLFSLITNLLMLTPTLYMLQVYDRVLVSRNSTTLIAVTLLTLMLLVIMSTCEWLRSRWLVRIGTRLDADLNTRIFKATFFAHNQHRAKQTDRSFSDLIELRQFLTSNGIFTLFDAPWTLIYIAVLFLLHPLLGGFAILFSIIQCLIAWISNRSHQAPSLALAQTQDDTNRYLRNHLRNAETVESMGMLEGLQSAWQDKHNVHLEKQQHTQALTHRLTAISKFVRYSQQSLSLAVGALLVIDGQLSPGAMIASNVLLTRALAPIDLLTQSWRGFISARSAFGRLTTLLNEFTPTERPWQQRSPVGGYTLRGVTVCAPGTDHALLNDINLTIEPGATVAVLGPSGAGKSTLARTLLGNWPLKQGELLLDGQPLDAWNSEELGQQVGYLPQDVELFEGTIAENIARFGEVDSERVIAAAQTTGLHETILRLPKGYDTPIGEAGRLLSGGQRQRVGLARAVYGTPQMVVLDEPNANLDDQGEVALLNTLRSLKSRQATVILITHRPGAVQLADQTIHLRNGRLESTPSPTTA